MGKFEIYPDKSGKSEWRWRLKADNGNIIAVSGEGYSNKADCEESMRLVKQLAPDADVVEIPQGRIANVTQWRTQSNGL